MFSIGMWSVMLPAGTPTALSGRDVALKLAGAVPIVQLIWAPVQHCNPIAGLRSHTGCGAEGTVVSPG